MELGTIYGIKLQCDIVTPTNLKLRLELAINFSLELRCDVGALTILRLRYEKATIPIVETVSYKTS